MRRGIELLAITLFCAGCPDAAGDCRNTLSCPLPPDAGAGVVYVVSDAGLPCEGVCAPLAGDSAGWSWQPFLFRQIEPALGPPETPCPANAPRKGIEVHANPGQAFSCPLCSCEPPSGACRLSETMTAGAASCGDADGGAPFDPPEGWDGGCVGSGSLAAACDGGPCVQSATAGPLVVEESGCVPGPPVVTKDVIWDALAYTCEGNVQGTCPSPGDICAPKPSGDFTLCVSRQGDDPLVPCPEGYDARYVLYLGAADTRGCAACTCGPPEGSACSSLVTFYTDAACEDPVGAVTATSASPMCVDLPAGAGPGSEQASPPSYVPGACQPGGGGETGSVQPVDPFTFCCLP